MAEREQVKSKGLELYEKFNKLTLVGWLGVAGVSAFVAPALVGPALGLAALDLGQVLVINRINKKEQSGHAAQEHVVYQR